ncbi:hypothetical protein ACI78T_12395 [Blastococcus sp. SYSU D00922]
MDDVRADLREDQGWEPADWAPLLRRRRRLEELLAAGLVLWVVAAPVIRVVVYEQPPFRWVWWPWLFVTVVYVGEVVRCSVTDRGRGEWEQKTRRSVRLRHALRHHVSIGPDERDRVGEHAYRTAFWSWATYLGLTAVAVLAVTEGATDGLPWIAAAMLGSAGAGVLVWTVVRHGRARRWLADPLPRED